MAAMVRYHNNNRSWLTWVLIGGGFLVYSITKTIADATALNWEINAFDLKSGTIQIGIINPTTSSYTVNAITANISDNDTRIAVVSYMGQVIIQPLATTNIKLNFKVDFAGLAVLLLGEGQSLYFKKDQADILKGKELHTIAVEGSANIDGIIVPIPKTTITAAKV